MKSTTMAVSPAVEREPRGFGPLYLLATFGTFYAILPPTLGGMSVKLQQLVGVANAPAVLGLMMGLGSLVALFTQPIIGRLSDNTRSRLGMRKPWIVIGTIGFVIGLCGVGVVESVALLIPLWCLSQIFSNIVQGSIHAVVADQVPEERLGFISGLGGVAIPVSFLLSALTLKALPTNELRSIVPACIGGSLCLLFVCMFKDKRLEGEGIKVTWRDIFSSFSFQPLKYRDYGITWISKALIMFGFASIASYLTLFLASSFKMTVEDQLQFNVYSTICSVVMMAVGSFFGGWASDKLGKRRMFVALSGVSIGLGVLSLAAAPLLSREAGLMLILAGQTFTGLGFGLFLSVDAALCIDVLPDPETKAKDLGVFNIANTLPGTIAPLIAGSLVIPFGNWLFPGWGFSTWFALTGTIAIAGGLIIYKVRGVA